MLHKFEPFELPGQLSYGRRAVDVAVFQDVYVAARAIERGCILSPHTRGLLGWQPVGKELNSLYHTQFSALLFNCPLISTGLSRSVGVFFWATESSINHDPRFPFRSLVSMEPETLDAVSK